MVAPSKTNKAPGKLRRTFREPVPRSVPVAYLQLDRFCLECLDTFFDNVLHLHQAHLQELRQEPLPAAVDLQRCRGAEWVLRCSMGMNVRPNCLGMIYRQTMFKGALLGVPTESSIPVLFRNDILHKRCSRMHVWEFVLNVVYPYCLGMIYRINDVQGCTFGSSY